MMTIGPRPAQLSLVLDTDVLNDWRYQKPPVVNALTEYISIVKGPPALTSITVFEALHGFEKTAARARAMDELTRQGAEQVRKLIASCIVLPFDNQATEIAAYIPATVAESAGAALGRRVYSLNCISSRPRCRHT
jgi:predicted nucleic acid-binding protein